MQWGGVDWRLGGGVGVGEHTNEQGLYATYNLSISRLCVSELALSYPHSYSAHIKCLVAIPANKSRTDPLYDGSIVTASFRLISSQIHLCTLAIYCANIRPNHHGVIRTPQCPPG